MAATTILQRFVNDRKLRGDIGPIVGPTAVILNEAKNLAGVQILRSAQNDLESVRRHFASRSTQMHSSSLRMYA